MFDTLVTQDGRSTIPHTASLPNATCLELFQTQNRSERNKYIKLYRLAARPSDRHDTIYQAIPPLPSYLFHPIFFSFLISLFVFLSFSFFFLRRCPDAEISLVVGPASLDREYISPPVFLCVCTVTSMRECVCVQTTGSYYTWTAFQQVANYIYVCGPTTYCTAVYKNVCGEFCDNFHFSG